MLNLDFLEYAKLCDAVAQIFDRDCQEIRLIASLYPAASLDRVMGSDLRAEFKAISKIPGFALRPGEFGCLIADPAKPR